LESSIDNGGTTQALDLFVAPPTGTIDSGTLIPVPQSTSFKMVKIKLLVADQRIYVDGTRMTDLNPHYDANYAFVFFIGTSYTVNGTTYSADNSNKTYTIFVSIDPTDVTKAILGKVESATSITLPVLGENRMAIAQVYWDGTNIVASRFGSGSSPIDMRSIGIVSTGQIATESISHPTKGLLANQNFFRCITNGDFSPAYGTSDWAISHTGSSGSISAINGTSYPAIRTTGPKKDSALKIPLTCSGGALDTKLRGKLPNMKPDQIYTASMWIASDSTNSVNVNNIKISVRLVNSGGTQRSLTENEFVFVRDGALYRLSTILKTDANPVVTDLTNAFEIRFSAASASAETYNFYITDVIVTEGEWTHANLPILPNTFVGTGDQISLPKTDVWKRVQYVVGGVLSRGQFAIINSFFRASTWQDSAGAYMRIRIDSDIPSGTSGRNVANSVHGVAVPYSYRMEINCVVYLSAGSHTVEMEAAFNASTYGATVDMQNLTVTLL
jgi:hypothetical protein